MKKVKLWLIAAVAVLISAFAIACTTPAQPALSNDTSLTVTSIGGYTVSQGEITVTAAQWQELQAVTDFEAASEYVLAEGADLTVTVEVEKRLVRYNITAEDGSTDAKYIAVILLSSETDLNVSSVMGATVTDSAVALTTAQWLELSAEQELMSVISYAAATGATATVALDGKNLVFTVTAEDGTVGTHTVAVTVLSNDTSLNVSSVMGVAVTGGKVTLTTAQWLELSAATDKLEKVVYTAATGATATAALEDKNLVFTVTAEDGTVGTHTVAITVLSNDTSLNVSSVMGVTVTGGKVTLTTAQWNELNAAEDKITKIEYALAQVAHATATLNNKTLTVTVTAEDGTVGTHTVAITVLSNLTELTVEFVNGAAVVDDAAVLTTPQWNELSAAQDKGAQCVYTSSTGATVAVTLADRTLTFAVTSEDGSATATKTVALTVLSNDTTFAVTAISGIAITGGDVTMTEAQHLAFVNKSMSDKLAASTYTVAENATVKVKVSEKVTTFTVTSEDGTETVDHAVTMTVLNRLVYEGEDLYPSAIVTGTAAAPRIDEGPAALLTGGKQAILIPSVAEGAAGGVSMMLPFSVSSPDTYRVTVVSLMNFDFGIVQYYLDGVAVGVPVDMYTTPMTTAEVDLGVHTLGFGEHTLKIEVVGKHESSTGYLLSLDYIALTKPDTTVWEVSTATTTAKSTNLTWFGQRQAGFVGNRTSDGVVLWGRADTAEPTAAFTFHAPEDGTYLVKVGIFKAVDFGKYQLRIDGANVGGVCDYYNGSLIADEYNAGYVTLTEGAHRVEFVGVGKNDAATNYHGGWDHILLKRVVGDERTVEIEHQRDTIVTTPEANLITQNMGGWTNASNDWSNETAILWQNFAADSTLSFELSVSEAGTYAVTMGFTAAADFGTVQIYVNDVAVGDAVDLYNNGVIAKQVVLGQAAFRQGVNTITVKCIGKNDSATNYLAGLDFIRLAAAG